MRFRSVVAAIAILASACSQSAGQGTATFGIDKTGTDRALSILDAVNSAFVATGLVLNTATHFVGVVATGGLTARSLPDRFADRLSIKDFSGAKPDDLIDDTAAINTALAAAGDRCVYFPSGVYLISSTITMNVDGNCLLGENAVTSLFGSGGTTGAVLKFTGTAGDPMILMLGRNVVNGQGMRVEGFKLDGNSLAGRGIEIGRDTGALISDLVYQPSVRDVTILGLRDNAASYGLMVSAYKGDFYNVEIRAEGAANAVFLGGPADGSTFNNFSLLGITHKDGTAILVSHADDNFFWNTRAAREVNGIGACLYIDGTTYGPNQTYQNYWFALHCGASPVFATPTAAIVSTGLYARGNAIFGLSGVDSPPTITIAAGSTLYIPLYSGQSLITGPTPADTLAEDAASSILPPIKILGYEVTDATTLDWYVESTVASPTIQFGASGLVSTYAGRSIRQTRIGNRVAITYTMALSSKAGASGALLVSFLGVSYLPAVASPCAVVATNMAATVGDTSLSGYISTAGGLAVISLFRQVAGVATTLNADDVTDTSSFSFSCNFAT